MSTGIEVIINAASGANNKEEVRRVTAAVLNETGTVAHIRLVKNSEKISELAREAATGGCEKIVAGGGDGTISAIAAELIGTEKILGVLPLGTLNHFAKDLKIPLDLKEAVRTVIEGNAVKVDVGEVNGRVFINNSSLGLYPEIVRGRERQERLGYGKWTSLVRSAFKVLRRYPNLDVRLNADSREISTRTPFVFIGNNEYEMESFNIGGRNCLDAGHLSLYMTQRTGRLALVKLALRAIIGKLGTEKDFISLCTDEVWIETRRKLLRVALDGEVMMLPTPIHYRVRPGALRVMVPAEKIWGDSI